MSESLDETPIPEYKVFTLRKEPFPLLGRQALAHIMAVCPSFDPPPDPNYFAPVVASPKVDIHPLVKVAGDQALLFVVHVKGNDSSAAEALEETIQNMESFVNPWRKPEEFLGLFFRLSKQ